MVKVSELTGRSASPHGDVRRPRLMLVHFWGNLHDLRGSVQQIIDVQCRHLQEFDIAVAHVGAAQPEAEIAGIDYLNFSEDRWRNRCFNKILGLHVFTFSELPRLIDAWRPDILHLHNRQELLPAIQRRLTHRPLCVLHYHRHFRQPALPAADLCLVPSQASLQYFQDLGATGDWRVLSNPIAATSFSLPELTAPARDPVRLLFSGGGQPGKGLHLVRAALNAEFEPACDWSLYVCGRELGADVGNDRRWHLLPYLERAAYLRLLGESAIVLLPSLSESFGLAAMEAAATGRYLVLSDLPAFRELLPAEAAWFFTCGDAADLRRALLAALQARQCGDLSRPRAARQAATGHNAEHFAQRLHGVYDELLRERRGSRDCDRLPWSDRALDQRARSRS